MRARVDPDNFTGLLESKAVDRLLTQGQEPSVCCRECRKPKQALHSVMGSPCRFMPIESELLGKCYWMLVDGRVVLLVPSSDVVVLWAEDIFLCSSIGMTLPQNSTINGMTKTAFSGPVPAANAIRCSFCGVIACPYDPVGDLRGKELVVECSTDSCVKEQTVQVMAQAPLKQASDNTGPKCIGVFNNGNLLREFWIVSRSVILLDLGSFQAKQDYVKNYHRVQIPAKVKAISGMECCDCDEKRTTCTLCGMGGDVSVKCDGVPGKTHLYCTQQCASCNARVPRLGLEPSVRPDKLGCVILTCSSCMSGKTDFVRESHFNEMHQFVLSGMKGSATGRTVADIRWVKGAQPKKAPKSRKRR